VKDFFKGFRALLPLYLGIVPFALAFAVTARAAGLSVWETQSLSLFVFAGASQFSAAQLFGVGAGGFAIVLTTFLLNIRHALYGLSLARQIPMKPWQRLAAGFFLTDEAYGIILSSGGRSFAFLLGAELSLYLGWNVFTLVGALAGSLVPDPGALGVDFVFPLSFLALLLPLLRARAEILVAVFCGALAWILSNVLPSGLPILVTGVAGSLLGAYLTRGEPVQPTGNLADAAREVA
jgi:predicted branched-subunit amino acid permease